MSGPWYHSFGGGPGNWWSETWDYPQAVTLGDVVKISGQGGWGPDRVVDTSGPEAQVRLAVENVDRILREAGLRGWEDVHYLRSYHVGLTRNLPILFDALRERIPEHRPVWTAIGVASLADRDSLIELEVEATRH
jgi:enamine deaminase RidA (YjgF/YER057c/UK114 family)